ncbi:Cellulose-growth-specific protein [Verticillium dahliae VDG2]|nr:Cellulose-growth-specific protein [Verticillium dahliae VDG2]
MRLIYAKTYELHEFFAGDVPPYAILSHTWADDEVTYHDIKAITSWTKPKQGFPKIQWACQEATVKGIDYVWVDTCCIDKSSSAELSEAINSMYQWYRDAQVCYAYLEDFPAQEKPAKAVEPGQVRKVDYTVFRQCRWFTRGWTLQELLAPPLVKFFSSNWVSIGSIGVGRSKAASAKITDALTGATGIDGAYLTHSLPLEDASVATKMSWASRRTCTRVEDTAYCLLGLFGINLPLLYGEGKRAFQRLQEEIWRETDDHSLLAWTVAPGDPRAWSLGSVFAESPLDFRFAGAIARTGDERGVPSAMTKMGLKLDLVSVPRPHPETSFLFGQPTYTLLLNCRLGDRRLAGLALLDLPDGPFERPYTLFTRIATPSQVRESPPEWGSDTSDGMPRDVHDGAELDTVIVRKNVTGRRKAVLHLDPGHAEVMLHGMLLDEFHLSSHFDALYTSIPVPAKYTYKAAQTIAIQGGSDMCQPLTHLECLLVPRADVGGEGNTRELIVLSCVIGMPGVGDRAGWKIALAFSRFYFEDGSHQFYSGVDSDTARALPEKSREDSGPEAPDLFLMDVTPEAPCDGMDLEGLAFQQFRQSLAGHFSRIQKRAVNIQGLLTTARIEVNGKGTLVAKLYRDGDRGAETHTPEGRHGFTVLLSLEGRGAAAA